MEIKKLIKEVIEEINSRTVFGNHEVIKITESEYDELYKKIYKISQEFKDDNIIDINCGSEGLYDPFYWESETDEFSYGTSAFNSLDKNSQKEFFKTINLSQFENCDLNDSENNDQIRQYLRDNKLIFLDTDVYDKLLKLL